jgi:phage tail sheath protein FI
VGEFGAAVAADESEKKEGPVPEYLAPGVYVEETSFRSKSIEGVSTSTTAFVGLARRGPVADDAERSETPELLTSYVDFERVFGGFEDLELDDAALAGGDEEKRLQRRNFLAHAVNAFFTNGGGRLYVARVAGAGAQPSASPAFAGGAASFRARVPGRAGDGRVVFTLGFVPLTARTWSSAPVGAVVRTAGGPSPTPARLTGTPVPRFFVRNGDALDLTVNGVVQTVAFLGEPAEVQSTPAAPLTIDASSRAITVTVDGVPQPIELDEGAGLSLAEVAADLNRKLAGGFAEVDGADFVIATDSRGSASRIAVDAPVLGFAGGAPGSGAENAPGAANNVKNLLALDAADLRGLLEPLNLRVDFTPDGAIVLSTVAVGAGASLALTGGSARAGLGLSAPVSEAPVPGTPPSFAVKTSDGMAMPAGTLHAVSLALTAIDKDGHARFYDDLGLDHRHPRFVGKVLPERPTRRSEQLENLFYLATTAGVDGAAWTAELMAKTAPFTGTGAGPDSDERLEREVRLAGGADGGPPSSADYKTAFAVLDRLDDVSIAAAPGYAAFKGQEDAIELELLAHVERRRSYRIGVLDARPAQSVGEVRQTKARTDSKYAALYYPWVVVANPLWRPGDANAPREVAVPPSGAVCGIYARNDVERGVYKAPANEVVRGALRFETDVNFAQQEVLNPLGVNCLRFFPGRGYRVWGGRTTSSDPEWKYVSVRRYFNYLERSIDVGTQWAVFEPNGERLWANVRQTVEGFLYNEWRSGALLGTDAREAYFVRCDRSTMDQNDLDNGRLVCLVGVAVVKPAEFVIFRVGQKTADART